ncbi:MAG: hypothetical protein GY835_05495 [bacterium]|nr:hypothetical protein [bacterium]
MSTKAQNARNYEEAKSQAGLLRKEILSIQREQGLLVAEMVWNEMRAWELKVKLDRDEEIDSEDLPKLQRDYALRLQEIRSLALWEAGADKSLRRQSQQLNEIMDSFPLLQDEMGDVLRLLDNPRLEYIARAAAEELGLPLKMSANASN